MAWESSQTVNTDKDSGESGFLNGSVEVHAQSRESSTPKFRGRMRYSQKTDTGWAWVICFGSFWCNVILDGMLFSFGIFFVHFSDYFGASKGRTALVGSAFMGTHLLLGPLTSTLVNLWGCRVVAIIGAFVTASGFILATMATNLEVLTLSYGFIGGAGVSMVYIPSIVAVGFYFEKHRALANGISSCGSGIGTFIYAPLGEYLVEQYAWRGALFILGAVALNCAAFGALFRPLYIRKVEPEDSGMRPRSYTGTSIGSTEVSYSPFSGRHKSHSDWNIPTKQNAISHHDLTTYKTPLDKGSSNRSMEVCNGQIHNPNAGNSMVKSKSSVGRFLQRTRLVSRSLGTNMDKCHTNNNSERFLLPLEKKDVFYSGSLLRLNRQADEEHQRASDLYVPSPLSSPVKDAGGVHTIQGSSRTTKCERCVNTFGIDVFLEPKFLLIIALSVLWTAHSSVLTLLPDFVIISGFSNTQAAMLISAVGVTNTIGRVMAGFASNLPRIDALSVNMVALFTGATVNFVIPYTSSYASLLIAGAVFGLCQATWTSLRPIILVDVLGLDRLTSSLGLLAMFQGAAFLVGPPLAGALYDHTGSYTGPFILCGVAFFLSGIFSAVLKLITMFCKRHNDDVFV